MPRRTTGDPPDEPLPFPDPLPPKPPPEKTVKRLRYPIWTEVKAKLIERYLYHFVLVTHHGTYIDGFAGPQNLKDENMWAAKLVLESEPPWLKYFYLFDVDPKQVERLEELVEQQPERDSKGRKIYRKIVVEPAGDFNQKVRCLLDSNCIKPKQATFCLLDQWSTECHWSTVQALANYKMLAPTDDPDDPPRKIELFYFLAVGWLGRTLAATTKDPEPLNRWWGAPDWEQLKGKTDWQLAEIFVDRFKNELGYRSVMQWPIFERESGGRVMYYMIHATDHPAALGLMSRAYDQALQPKVPLPESLFEWRLPPAEKVKRRVKRMTEAAKKAENNSSKLAMNSDSNGNSGTAEEG
jgi:three-Cys-motif partner protein